MSRSDARRHVERAGFVAEALATYGLVRWQVRRRDLPAAVARLREGRAQRLPFGPDAPRVMRARRLPFGPDAPRVARAAHLPFGPDAPRVARSRRLPFGPDAPRVARAAERVVARLPGDSRCLMRALVVLAMLARRGIDVRLVLAARPSPSFAAHAWVERDGQPLLPTRGFGDARLTEL